MSPEKRKHTPRPDKTDPSQQKKEQEALLNYDHHVIDALVSEEGKLAPEAVRDTLPQNLTLEEVEAVRLLIYQAEDIFDKIAQATPQWQEFQRRYSELREGGRVHGVKVLTGKRIKRIRTSMKEEAEIQVPQKIYGLFMIRRDIDNDERLEGYMRRTTEGLSASLLRDRVIRLDKFVRENLSTQI